MIKTCSKCKTERTIDLFAVYGGKVHSWCKLCQRRASNNYRKSHLEKSREMSRKYRERNLEKCLAKDREYKAANREILRAKDKERRKRYIAENPLWEKNRNLKYTYGIDMEKYNSMLSEQGGGCAICGGTNPDGRMLSVDHNHDTGAVRGLLCIGCNFGIGSFKDNPERMISAFNYLKKYESKKELTERDLNGRH